MVYRVLVACDNVYHRLYYAIDLTWRSKHLPGICPIPKPHVYFSSYAIDEATVNRAMKSYILSSFSASYKNTIINIFGLSDRNQLFQDNPLLSLHFSRWRESICFFQNHPVASERICTNAALLPSTCVPEVLTGAHSHASMKPQGDPLLPPAIRAWNDACRTWACHLYAYATPCPAALDLLAEYAPILEVGAGTGYWAYTMRKRHPEVTIIAYDKDPPSFAKDVKSNSYHGRAAAWTTVLKGGVEKISMHPGATLFLCYPPPDNDMALQALRLYEGEYLCYCGEYRGDTGTKSFEQLLEQKFVCLKFQVLPNWADTCYSLTVWKRRDSFVNLDEDVHPLRCWACGALKQAMLRCRVSCSLSVCNEDCASAARRRHLDELAHRYVLCGQEDSLKVNESAQSNEAMQTDEADMSQIYTSLTAAQKRKIRKKRILEGINNTEGSKTSQKRPRSEYLFDQVPLLGPVFPKSSNLFTRIITKSCTAVVESVSIQKVLVESCR